MSMSTTMFMIVLFVKFVAVNGLPKFEPYRDNVINRNIAKISSSHCDWLATHCGISNVGYNDHQIMKIVGGQEAKLSQVPWAVFVLIQKTVTMVPPHSSAIKTPVVDQDFRRCTGTLISKSHVLTAAHCFINEHTTITSTADGELNFLTRYDNETQFKVQLITGAVDIELTVDINSKNVTWRKEKARIISPDYTAIWRRASLFFSPGDYAIVEFEPALNETEMEKSESTVRPVCLPQYGQRLADSFRVSGWGAKATRRNPDTLETKIAYREVCNETVADFEPLCTSRVSGSGDSGTGYIQQVNNLSTIVAVLYGKSYHISPFMQSFGILLDPTEDIGQRVVPLKWIRDNIFVN